MDNNFNYNYYRDQLNKLNVTNLKYPAMVKIVNSEKSESTKFLSLNDESASELVKWLKENFNIKNV